MCQNPPGDEIYIPYCGGKLHQIDMPPSYTIFFSKCFMGLEALGFARLIGSDHNSSGCILQEINENTVMAPRQEGLLEESEESIRVSRTWIALNIELVLNNRS
jgi:hypothetical protein